MEIKVSVIPLCWQCEDLRQAKAAAFWVRLEKCHTDNIKDIRLTTSPGLTPLCQSHAEGYIKLGAWHARYVKV
jgi:hypothetical protein